MVALVLDYKNRRIKMNVRNKLKYAAMLLIFTWLSSCQTVLVSFPVPVTVEFPLAVVIPEGQSSFSTSASISGDDIAKLFYDQLGESFSKDDIQNYDVEGIAFEVTQTNNPGTTISGEVFINTGNGSVELFSLDNVALGQAIGNDVVPEINPVAVANLKQTLTNIFEQGVTGTTFETDVSGNVNQGSATAFTFVVKITVATVINQNVEVFDPL
jgi:hypothetical protein